ncbi:uncharacterized protein LOC129948473 [Eupeodes corollae]|uniref:uncharacterized protein LOC129948473 n=1 Tax=Eupeodes corollae TaxID=290404 RepID=UPI002491C600|nr:uncharacterized protein LOC129948473 [Eupeodes corollae]
MERIVLGISSINLYSSSETFPEKPVVSNAAFDSPIENCRPSTTNQSFSFTMATTGELTDGGDEFPADYSDQTEAEYTPPRSRRSLPPRMAKSKENSLLRIKRRSIMKPRRNLNVEIKKIYLDNKVKGNFRPSNLETIFEEPTPDKNKQLCFIGAKKIKRSLSCSDGLNVTKTTVKSRRNKIKKTFGRRFALKKISLDDFIDRLNASFEDKPFSSSQSVPQTPTTTYVEDKADETTYSKAGDVNEADDMECSDETLL